MKQFLIIALVLLGVTPLWAQISEGGTPPSFSFKSSLPIPVYEAVRDFDVNALLQEDDARDEIGLPPHCARIIPVNLNMENSGRWVDLSNGQRVWQLEIYSPEAMAIMLYYDKFIIPEGSKLFIYNPDRSKVLGAYTSKTNSMGKEFATEFVYGDRIILEYLDSPVDGTVKPEIEITGVAYGYNNLRVPVSEGIWKTRWDSDACMININCPEGDDWQEQKKGVARIVTPVGMQVSLCTGTLINNTSFDNDPLFLSAFHCYDGMTESQMNQSVYYFHYEDSGCERELIDHKCPTIVGAQSLVTVSLKGGSDGALVRLNSAIPEEYDVYFNGWDRRNVQATSGVGIHHPNGDVKKISTYTTSPTSTSWSGDGGPGGNNAHWSVYFSATESGHGVIQRGSSGSPLFNQDKLIIATLTGGSVSCTNKNGRSYYGKFWYHWDQGAEDMSQYLDPLGTGVETLQGTRMGQEVAMIDFSYNEDDLYVLRPIQFTDNSFNAKTYDWTFEGATPSTSNEETPSAITYNTPGVYKVSLTINKGTDLEMTKEVSLNVIIKENLCPDNIEVGQGTSTSQFPLGSLQRQTLTSSLYTKDELGMANGGEINQISWNTANQSTRTRTLFIYMKETDDESLVADTWENEIEGAKLVCQSSDTWKNSAGWATIDLDKPFRYSGKKNLKVIVRSLTTTAGAYSSSNCYYTTAANKNMQWTSTTESLPTTEGTIDANRPNIRLNMGVPCGVIAPVADFKMNDSSEDTIEIKEGESVAIESLSTGPVVNWYWTFQGITPDTSLEENPVITYEQEGTYNIELKVENHLGQSVKTKTVVVTSEQSSLDDLELKSQLNVYPNPVDDILTVKSNGGLEKVYVQDIQGRTVYSISSDGKDLLAIPASDWDKGIYIIRVQTNKGTYNQKVIKK